MSLIYGKNAVFSALEQNKVVKLYLVNDIKLKYHGDIKYLTKEQMNQLVGNTKHQNIAADVFEYQYYQLKDLDLTKPLLILDKIQDGQNFGAIIRTCAGMGIEGIIIAKHQQVAVNATVEKCSAGNSDKVKIVQVANLNQTIDLLKKQGYWIVATSASGQAITSLDLSLKYAVIMGNEHKGVSRLLQENSDFLVSLPISSQVESYNVSVATALILYHLLYFPH